MNNLFSERFGLASNAPVDDEAPKWLREALFLKAISPFLRGSSSNRTMGTLAHIEQNLERPILCSSLIQHIALANQISPPPHTTDLRGAAPALHSLLLSLSWGRFYDVLEVVAVTLAAEERKTGLDQAKQFRALVNNCFNVGSVNWFLNSKNSLERSRSADIDDLEKQVRRGHEEPYIKNLDKAKSFLNNRPADAANSIKESISAVESYARKLDPAAKSLGDALSSFKKKQSLPPLLITAIEKLYAFTCAEPGVRHGSNFDERVERGEAEFVYIIATAVIQYLNEKSK